MPRVGDVSPKSGAGLALLLGAWAGSVLAADILNFTFLRTFPTDRELSHEGASSEGAQGIAAAGNHWYYASTTQLYRLNPEFGNADSRLNIAALRFGGVGCNHFGGIDYFDGEVYVALDKCSDDLPRILVVDESLRVRRSATIPGLGKSIPWVAVNPVDAAHLYTVRSPRDDELGSVLITVERNFLDAAELGELSVIQFADRPEDVAGDHFWRQGGAFSANGLFFRVVDDNKDENAAHTGVWVYELDPPGVAARRARRVGFINIRYDPDIWAPNCGFSGQCNRSDELEDLDARAFGGIRTQGDLHVLMLSNELWEDDISVYHYRAGDLDADGVLDTVDNCFRHSNAGQTDLDRNGIGLGCDQGEVVRALVPALFPVLL